MYWDVSRIPPSQEPFTCSSDTLIATHTAHPMFLLCTNHSGPSKYTPPKPPPSEPFRKVANPKLAHKLSPKNLPSTSPTSQSLSLLIFAQNSNVCINPQSTV